MRNRKLFLRYVVPVVLLALLAAGLLYAQNGPDDIKPRYRISVIVDRSADARWLSFRAGMEQGAEENNLGISIVPTGLLTSAEEERKLAEEELAQGAEGLIIEPCGLQDAEGMVSGLAKQTALVLVETDTGADPAGASFAAVGPDNGGIGRALAVQLADAYGRDLAGLRIGVVAGRVTQAAVKERLEAFTEAVTAAGGIIVWTIEDAPVTGDRLKTRQEEHAADVIAALENNCLETAVDYLLEQQKEQEEGAETALFGVGNSEKNVYYLDRGLIGGMVVPDEYDMGYRAALAVAERINSGTTPEKVQTGFAAVTRETMFEPAHARLLFPIAQ